MLLSLFNKLFHRSFDAKANWIKRFASFPGDWRAVGDVRLTEQQYRQANDQKKQILSDTLLRFVPQPAKKHLLDGGCGHGDFSDHFRQMGFRVTGIDFMEDAIRTARQRYPQCEFALSDLADLKLPHRFDAIATIDTLINVVDETLWRKSLQSMADHLAPQGFLVIMERLRQPDETFDLPPHVVFRTPDDYRRSFTEIGLTVIHHERFFVQAQNLSEDILVIQPAL